MVTTAATTASAESAGNSAVAEAPAVPAAMGAGLGRKDAKRKCKKEEDSSKSTVEPEPEAAAEITADHAVRSAAEPVDAAACASELAAGSSSSSGGHGGGWDGGGVNSAAGRVDTPSAIAPPCAAPLPPTVPPLPHAVPDAVVITVVKALERIEAALAAEQSRARVIDVQIQRLEGQVSAVHGTLGRTMALLQQMSERMLPSAAPERSALALGAAEPHAITPRPQQLACQLAWASPSAAIDEVMFAAEATIAPPPPPPPPAATTTMTPLTADSVDHTLTEAQRQKIDESRRQALARRQGVRYPPAGGTAGNAPLPAGMQPQPLTVGAGPATTAEAAGPFAVAAAATAATAGTSYAPLPGTSAALLTAPCVPPAPAPPPLTPAQHIELATAYATGQKVAAERRKAAELLGLETVGTNTSQQINGQKAFKRPRPYSVSMAVWP